MNEVRVYPQKIFLIPANELGIKLWGMVDYLCEHCGWKWKTMTGELKSLAQELRREKQEKKEKSRKGKKRKS
jgi:hypothetical protein